MDFDWTEEEAAFRAEVKTAIATHCRPDWSNQDFELSTPELREECRQFCMRLAESGLLTPNWPVEYGGRDAPPWEQVILSEEVFAANEPRGPQYMNVNWIGPAIMAAGTPEQKEYHLRRIAAGDVFWCQGFSEPEAGSDLASLKTSAVRDGDVYVVNGQKIWTSYAHVAEFCFLLVRTDPNSKRGEGISVLLVPMDLPGIEVRDIPNFTGHHIIHEVFFTDVRVPASCLLGEENKGWQLVLNVLANERIGIARQERWQRVFDWVVNEARRADPDRFENDATQEALGFGYAFAEAARVLNHVAVDERIHDPDGKRSAASVSRVATSLAEKEAGRTAASVLGQESLVVSPADRQIVVGTLTPIAAGSYEVQLNNVARMSLGLPKG